MKAKLPVTQFGLTAEVVDDCARLVLAGDKRATTSLLASYAFDREAVPVVGQRSVVHDRRHRAVATIAVTAVETRRFCDVDATFAATEGEGDKSLTFWRSAHWEYLTHECARVGVELSPQVALVLEQFKVVEKHLSLDQF